MIRKSRFGITQASIIFLLLEYVGCQKDDSLRDLTGRFWEWKLREFPQLATAEGFYQHNDKLQSYVDSDFENRKNTCVSFLAEAEEIYRKNLTRDDQLTLDVFKDNLKLYIEGYKWKNYGSFNPINKFFGIHRNFGWIFQANFNCTEEYDRYFKRLSLIPRQITEVMDLLYKAINARTTNHAVSMKGIEAEMDVLTYSPADRIPFYQPFKWDLDELDIQPYLKQGMRNRALRIMKTRIQPSFKRLKRYITDTYLPETRKDIGVGSLPDGHNYYRSLLKWHLSVPLEPLEVHNLGLSEVKRIKIKLRKVMNWLGYQGDLVGFFRELRNQRHLFNHTKTELLELYRTTIYHRIQPRLPLIFSGLDTIPNITVVPSLRDSIEAGYSQNHVIINTYRPHTRPSFNVLPIALHEGSPGHHLQMSFASKLSQPKFRNHTSLGRDMSAAPFSFPPYTSYVEGWALYAESLGTEIGLYDNPYEQFASYNAEIFRASRLVVDTGIHAFRWNRDQAIDYLLNHTFISRKQAEIEIDRYITFPGQACAYKVGEIEIMKLRRKAEAAFGNSFNIKKFHEQLLQVGAVPLTVLETRVTEWIQSRAGVQSSTSTTLIPYLSLLALLNCFSRVIN